MTWTRHENGAGATPTLGRRRRRRTALLEICMPPNAEAARPKPTCLAHSPSSVLAMWPRCWRPKIAQSALFLRIRQPCMVSSSRMQ